MRRSRKLLKSFRITQLRCINEWCRKYGPNLLPHLEYTICIADELDLLEGCLEDIEHHFNEHLKHVPVEVRGLTRTTSGLNPTVGFFHRIRQHMLLMKAEELAAA